MSVTTYPVITGVPNGKAPQFYQNFSLFPSSGESGVIYVDIDNKEEYLWTGSMYELFAGGGAGGDTDTVPEGVVNLYYTNARADARIAIHSGLADPHPQYTTSAEVSAEVNSAISSSSISALSDVEFPSAPASGDVLYHNGSTWTSEGFEILLEGASLRQYTLLLDEVSSTITYVGEALPGSSTGIDVWRIKRIETIGPDVEIKWAEDSADFDKVWEDRESYTYS